MDAISSLTGRWAFASSATAGPSRRRSSKAPYYRIDGLTRVAPAFQGKPVLTAEQIEDVVAYLATLRNE